MMQSKRWTKKVTTTLLLAAMLAVPAVNGLTGDILWTADGTENVSWEYGKNADGEYVWATGLGTPHNHPECSFLESANLPGALFEEDTLEMQHSYEMEGTTSRFGTKAAFDGGMVLVSRDNGATWQKVSMDYPATHLNMASGNHSCVEAMETERTPGFFTNPDGVAREDVASTGNIGTIELTDTVRIRFGFFASESNAGNGLDGWEIQSVRLGGVDLMPLLGVDDGDLPAS